VLLAPCLLLCVHGLGLLASSVRRAGNGDDGSSRDLATTRKENRDLVTARKEKSGKKHVGPQFWFFEVNYGELLEMSFFFLSLTNLGVAKLQVLGNKICQTVNSTRPHVLLRVREYHGMYPINPFFYYQNYQIPLMRKINVCINSDLLFQNQGFN
jgi:hypothetical protein